MSTPLTPAEAASRILEAIHILPPEKVRLRDAAGRVIAADIVSPIDIPPWDNSAMDGYAARAGDLIEAGTTLCIVERVHAGAFPTLPIGPGECTRIFTGAPIPEGADSVVRQEDTTELDDGTVRIDDTRDGGRHIRRRGEDVRRGETVLNVGVELAAAHLGILASIAESVVPVYRRPTVALLATGDEIADVDEREAILAGRKIASSNSYTMAAMVEEAGGIVLPLGIANDDPVDIGERLAAAASADLLVTSAGMSVGEHDHLRQLLEKLGTGMRFWRLRSRPGAPVGFGIIHGIPWIGLPGNPVSTMVTFELFVRPAIRRMRGLRTPFRQPRSVRLAEPVRTPGRLQHFLRATLETGTGMPEARLTGSQGSGILTSMAGADALLIVPEQRDTIEVGETVDAIVFTDGVHTADIPY